MFERIRNGQVTTLNYRERGLPQKIMLIENPIVINIYIPHMRSYFKSFNPLFHITFNFSTEYFYRWDEQKQKQLFRPDL
jgi:hypothetical protein